MLLWLATCVFWLNSLSFIVFCFSKLSLDFLVKEWFFGFLNKLFEFFPICHWLRDVAYIQLCIALFFPSCFRMFINFDKFGVLISEIFWDYYAFLYSFFQWLFIRNIKIINITYYIFELNNKLFILFIICYEWFSSQ